jgi:hypothetical protein
MEKNKTIGYVFSLVEFNKDLLYHNIKFYKDFGIFKKGDVFDFLEIDIINNVIYAYNYTTPDKKWKQELIISPK